MPVRLEERAADTVALIGELDLQSVPGLWAVTQRRFRRQPPRRVDLSGVERADSAGVALLVEWLRLARNHQAELQFINVPAQMTAIIRVAALDDVLPLVNGVAEPGLAETGRATSAKGLLPKGQEWHRTAKK